MPACSSSSSSPAHSRSHPPPLQFSIAHPHPHPHSQPPSTPTAPSPPGLQSRLQAVRVQSSLSTPPTPAVRDQSLAQLQLQPPLSLVPLVPSMLQPASSPAVEHRHFEGECGGRLAAHELDHLLGLDRDYDGCFYRNREPDYLLGMNMAQLTETRTRSAIASHR